MEAPAHESRPNTASDILEKKTNLKPNSGVLIYILMTTEGQWGHPCSSVIISLWTTNVTCFLRQKILIEGEHKNM